MKSHIHKFNFISSSPRKGDMPFKPFLKLTLASWSESKNGLITLTPDLISDQEMDANIDALKKDLDRVGQMAKLELEKINNR